MNSILTLSRNLFVCMCAISVVSIMTTIDLDIFFNNYRYCHFVLLPELHHVFLRLHDNQRTQSFPEQTFLHM